LAVTVAYGSLLGVFAWKLCAFEAGLYAFAESAVAYFTKLVGSWHAATFTVGAHAFLHSGTLFTGDSANTHFHTSATP
jgi:hypothetical protein